MANREKVIKALECRKNAGKRCGNPCEETGLCHYATAVRDLNGEIYIPFVCDKERICTDAIELLKVQTLDIEALKNTIQGMVEGQCIIAGSKQQQIVRCKDCKHHGRDTCSAGAGMAYPTPEDWFCADGEKRQ